MVFPLETEDRTMRKLLMLCQDNTRIVVEAYRKCLVIFDSLIKEDSKIGLPQIEEIKKIGVEATKLRGNLIHELNEVGGILTNRDDFLRLVGCFSEMLDYIEGIAVFLTEIKSRGMIINKKTVEGIMEIADLSFDSQLKLRDAIMSLGFNSEKSLGFAKEIDDIEQKADSLSLQLDLYLLTSKIEILNILLLREVIKRLENLVNKVKEASDIVRIIAL